MQHCNNKESLLPLGEIRWHSKYIIYTEAVGYLLHEIDNDTISQLCGHESISKAMNYPLVAISDATDKMSTFQSEGPPLQHP